MVVASILDDEPWVTYDAINEHYTTTVKLLRTDMGSGGMHRFAIFGAEKALRRNWYEFSLTEKDSDLSEIIRGCADRFRTQWPSLQEIYNANKRKKETNPGTTEYNRKRRFSNWNENEKPKKWTDWKDNGKYVDNLKRYMCINHQNGRCNLGEKCPRAHTKEEQEAAEAEHNKKKRN